MKLKEYSLGLFFVVVMIISCENNKAKNTGDVAQKVEPKIELCVGDYLTEAEGKAKLDELLKNYSSASDWRGRAAAIRAQIRKGAKLDEIGKEKWEYPIKVVSKEKRDMEGYSVENIELEMHDGYFVYGNLYIPEKLEKKNPAVISPHGHWFQPEDYGRLRPDVQYRAASLAKMGAVVFVYDMYGTGEDIQHRHHSPEALTYQCYNGIRILDYITSLDYVDASRIGITGASGGGTQTFLVAALDDRISVSVPTVMVSAHFYGGCVCESGMPIHKSGDFETNNVEIAASIAPKPLMIIGDGNDWTKNISTVEYPFINSIYKLFGAEANTEYAFFKDEVHDYGISKRTATYGFMAKHLDLDISKIQDDKGEIDESFVQILENTQLQVYPDRELVKDPMD